MCEYVGMPYFAVLKHAFLPAVISYIALLYLVHLEAMKADMPVLPKPGGRKPLPMTLLTSGITIASILILCGLVYRSEEHTSELQSLMRISYAVFCLKKKKKHNK